MQTQIFNNDVVCAPIKTTYNKTSDTLLVMTPANPKDFNPIEWIGANKAKIETALHANGGVLLRNFGIYSVSEFNKVVQSLYPNLLDYTYRSTPRTKLGGKIYTTTEYPADRTIPLHNENAYSDSWPNRICFFCAIAPEEGGETPIADSRRVYNKIDSKIRSKFELKGILYVKNYNKGIDLSWQEVFQAENKEDVDKFCKEHGIEAIWKNAEEGPELTTKQVCQATYIHPTTKEKVWFNQAHLFHSSALHSKDRDTLTSALGEQNLPRNTFYGDGEAIETGDLDHIRKIYDEEKITFTWHKGDLMILDNVLVAHAREPFKGERKIVVAMA